MTFNHQQYNQQYLTSPAPINDAVKYGVSIAPANVSEGEMYWRAIGVHHLLPEENMSNHHVYFDVLDESGKRVTPPAWIGWTWEGRGAHEPAPPAVADKPPYETATNIAIWRGQRLSVWVQGKFRDATDKSDVVKGLHFEHADEPLPDGRLLNTYGHHSFYVVYQWTRKGNGHDNNDDELPMNPAPINPTPITPPPVVIDPPLSQRLVTLEANLAELQRRISVLENLRWSIWDVVKR